MHVNISHASQQFYHIAIVGFWLVHVSMRVVVSMSIDAYYPLEDTRICPFESGHIPCLYLVVSMRLTVQKQLESAKHASACAFWSQRSTTWLEHVPPRRVHRLHATKSHASSRNNMHHACKLARRYKSTLCSSIWNEHVVVKRDIYYLFLHRYRPLSINTYRRRAHLLYSTTQHDDGRGRR